MELTREYKKELVVALNMQRFLDYCKRHNRNPHDRRDAVYIHNAEALLGIGPEADTRIALVQGWVQRADWQAIWQRLHVLRACGVVIGEDRLPDIISYQGGKTRGVVVTPDNWNQKRPPGAPPIPGVHELHRRSRGLVR